MFFRMMFFSGFLAMTAMSAQAQMDHSKMKHENPAAHTEAGKAFDAAMAKMHKDMTVKQTGNTDADFLLGMIPHHQGAIDMAKIELRYGRDEKVRKLAKDIIKAQEAEIAFMKDWLAKNGR